MAGRSWVGSSMRARRRFWRAPGSAVVESWSSNRAARQTYSKSCWTSTDESGLTQECAFKILTPARLEDDGRPSARASTTRRDTLGKAHQNQDFRDAKNKRRIDDNPDEQSR